MLAKSRMSIYQFFGWILYFHILNLFISFIYCWGPHSLSSKTSNNLDHSNRSSHSPFEPFVLFESHKSKTALSLRAPPPRSVFSQQRCRNASSGSKDSNDPNKSDGSDDSNDADTLWTHIKRWYVYIYIYTYRSLIYRIASDDTNCKKERKIWNQLKSNKNQFQNNQYI